MRLRTIDATAFVAAVVRYRRGRDDDVEPSADAASTVACASTRMRFGCRSGLADERADACTHELSARRPAWRVCMCCAPNHARTSPCLDGMSHAVERQKGRLPEADGAGQLIEHRRFIYVHGKDMPRSSTENQS